MTTAAVRPYPGTTRPTLFIDDQPHSGFSYMTYVPDAQSIREFDEIGCNLFFFSATSDDCMYEFADRAWVAPDRYDYSSFDERFRLFRENTSPQAKFIIRIYMTTPQWWDDAHPEELVVFDDGSRDRGLHFPTARKSTYPSLASAEWRESTIANLRRFIRHVEDGPWRGRVAGYHIASQHTEEWFAFWIYQEWLGDYSVPATQAWRQWLRSRYGNDRALQGAWGVRNVSLEDAPMPTGDERRAGYQAEFRQLPGHQNCIDYGLFFSDLMVDAMEQFCHTAKQEVQGRKVIGAFYGYLLQFAEHLPVSGHLATQRAFSCPWIDFFTSPTASLYQQLGQGYAFFMAPWDSVRAHGKLWINENDAPTWDRLEVLERVPDEGLAMRTPADSRMLQRREVASTLSRGVSMWWFDMFSRWYSDAEQRQEIRLALELADRLKTRGLASCAEILVVVDAPSFACQGWRSLLGPCIPRLIRELGHAGAPFDVVERAELEQVLSARHRLVIFANLWQTSSADRQGLSSLLELAGRTVVWLYMPGAVAVAGEAETDAAQRSRELTGVAVAPEGGEAVWPGLRPAAPAAEGGGLEFARRWTAWLAGHELGESCPREISSEGVLMKCAFRPVRVAADTGLVLAKSEWGTPGIVLRNMGSWSSVCVAAPLLTASWLQALMAAAGVHIYLESGDAIYLNESVLAVAARPAAGPRVVRLRNQGAWRDAYSGQVHQTDDCALELNMQAGEVCLLERLDWFGKGSETCSGAG